MRGRSELKWSIREECESVRLMEMARQAGEDSAADRGVGDFARFPPLNRIGVRSIRQSFDLAEQKVSSSQSELKCQQEIEMFTREDGGKQRHGLSQCGIWNWDHGELEKLEKVPRGRQGEAGASDWIRLPTNKSKGADACSG